MTDADLWLAVGRVLAARRVDLGYAFTKQMARADPKAPHEVTMNAIERGRPGNITSLSDYCAALGLNLSEVIAGVLPGSALSPEPLRVARRYEAAPELVQKAVRLMLAAVPPTSPTRRDGDTGAPLPKPGRSDRAR